MPEWCLIIIYWFLIIMIIKFIIFLVQSFLAQKGQHPNISTHPDENSHPPFQPGLSEEHDRYGATGTGIGRQPVLGPRWKEPIILQLKKTRETRHALKALQNGFAATRSESFWPSIFNIYIYIYNLSINCNLQISINPSVFDALMTGHSAPQPGWWPCYLGLGAGTHHHVFIVRMSSHLLCRIYLVQPLARAQAGVSKGPGVETCLSKSWRCLKAWIGWLNFWVTSVSCSSMGCVKVCKMHVFMLMHTLCGQGTGQGWTIQSQKEEQHQEDEADEHDYIQ